MQLSLTTYQTLLCLPNVGRKTARAIASHLSEEISGPEDLLIALGQAKASGVRITLPERGAVATAFDEARAILDRAFREGLSAHGFGDGTYPQRLRNAPDSPLVLYTKGDHGILNATRSIALIGTRSPSPLGAIAARTCGSQLATLNAAVVSGLAIGCDAEGHVGCLSSRGKAIAVLAHGLHTVSPATSIRLAARLVEAGGCLVSEYPYGEPPQKKAFIERNRLQSGLADAVIVIEAAASSGSMHTVGFAESQSRPVACLCLSAENNTPADGNASLIQSGRATPLPDSSAVAAFVESIYASDSARIEEMLAKPSPGKHKTKHSRQQRLMF